MEGLVDYLDDTSEGYAFEVDALAPGVRLHVQPTTRFKQVTVKLYQLQTLNRHAGERALIPMVLRCGCAAYSTREQIALRLQELYGATLNVQSVKFGHVHMQKYELSHLASRFLDDPDVPPEESMSLLFQILTEPVMERGVPQQERRFPDRHVQQQRKQLLDLIDSRKEDKRSYAVHRCIKHLFMEDPYSRSRYGNRNHVESILPKTLYNRYTSDLSVSQFDLVVVGDRNMDRVRSMVEEQFKHYVSPERDPVDLEPVLEPSGGSVQKQITEPGDGDQSWLVLGYRTAIVMGHPDMYVLSTMAGLFGGFPHSKLHQLVREKKGLAYNVQASLRRSVGLLLVTAGIDRAKREKTVIAIKTCRQQMVEGDFSDRELQVTRRKLIEQLVDLEDSPSQKADSYHNRHLSGNVENLDQIADRLLNVERQEIQRVAENLTLRIEYCLE